MGVSSYTRRSPLLRDVARAFNSGAHLTVTLHAFMGATEVALHLGDDDTAMPQCLIPVTNDRVLV